MSALGSGPMDTSFRSRASFGRRIEYWIIGQMLKHRLDVYVPLVDDFGIDAIIRKSDGTFIEVQIKARSENVRYGSAARFSAISHPEKRDNYFFIFYSEILKSTWILSSEEFIDEARQNKSGKNQGKRSIVFGLTRNQGSTGGHREVKNTKFDKYLDDNFSRFREAGAVVMPETPSQNDEI
ncbi:PDDEXK-like family protein [Roseococcus microcysteis]|uniref:hypothetical protein n=1 Tax=Roseococcus microcysteis TaxID=2771361 RepID=UPI001CC65453|nr:hypothetical protein [Roseococcus microcysteis]